MENPTDRVTYGDLRMIRSEFEELMQLSIEAGTIAHPIPYESYMDESFARNAQPADDRALRCASPAQRALAARSRCCARSCVERCRRRRSSRRASSTRRARRPTSRCADPTARELKLSRYRGKVVILAVRLHVLPRRLPDDARDAGRRRAGSSAPQAKELQVVYVTVDPERDDAERLRELPDGVRPHVRRRHGNRRTARQRCVATTASPPRGRRSEPSYAFSHSSYTYLIDREGKLRALMPYGHAPDDYVHDVKILLEP